MLYMDRRYSDIEFLRMPAINQYRLILYNKFYTYFPRGFWLRPDGKERALLMYHYLFEEVLNWNSDTLVKMLRPQLLKQYKLDTPLRVFFNNDIMAMLDEVYPNKYAKWMFFSNRFVGTTLDIP